MNNRHEKIVTVIRDFSRNIFILVMLSIIIGAITGVKILVWLGVLLLIVSWIAPGIFILFNAPWLAQTWLRGINPTWIPATPWEQLSNGKKFLIYLNSLIFSGFIVIAFVVYVIQELQK